MSHKKKQEHVNHERWLISYADFITLLFAFFVVLFSASQSDKKKVQKVEYSIHSAFQTMGIFPMTASSPNLQSVGGAPNTATVMMGDDLDASPKTMADLNKMKAQLDALLAAEIAHRTVTVQVGRDGLIISLRAAGFFESASATPIPASMHTLLSIGSALAITPYDVRIEGHTDNIPIHNSQYQSNWELSTARATELAQIFIETSHVVPSHLSAAGYAEYHPLASNATAEGRNRNRRVDIIVLPHISHHEELWMEKSTSNPSALEKKPSAAAANHMFEPTSEKKPLASPALFAAKISALAIQPTTIFPPTSSGSPPHKHASSQPFLHSIHAAQTQFLKPSPEIPASSTGIARQPALKP